MRITRKLLVPTFILLAILAVGLILIDALSARASFERQEARRLSNLYQSFVSQIDTQGSFSTGLAMQVANNPDVQVAFDASNRDRLIAITYPSFLVINSKFDISQYQFHLPDGTTYLRLNTMDKSGGDGTTGGAMVIEANSGKQTVSGLEVGGDGLGVRSVVPVSYSGKHVGTVTFRMQFDLKALKGLQDSYGSDWQILLRRDLPGLTNAQGARSHAPTPAPELLLQASTLEQPFFARAQSYREALSGKTYVEHVSIGRKSFTFFSAPVQDYSGKVVGVVNIISDWTPVVRQQINRLIITVGVILGVLFILAYGLARVTSRTLKPIGELTEAAEAVASGNLNRDVPVKGRDELTILATAFNSMTAQLRSLVGSLEERVAERTRAIETNLEVSRRLSTILEPEKLVTEVVEQLRLAFGYYHAHIYWFDDKRENLVLAGGTGEVGKSLMERGHMIPKGMGLVGKAAENNVHVLVPDVSIEPDWLPNPLLPDTKSEVAVPISVGEQVLGVLDVQENEVGALHAEDVTVLQSISAQIAIAIQNAWAYTRTQRQAEREAMIASIAQQIQSTWSVEDALKVTARELGRALGVPQVRVRLGSYPAEGAQIIAPPASAQGD